jgi:D-alanyl-D-alanine carboxypeptidase/D-alanyl-D-alanine-endopeptidase (penicillin-binding protein 4)
MIHALVLALNFLATSTAPPPDARDVRYLQAVVARAAGAYPMNTAQLGVVVEDARSGKRLVMRQAEHEFAPASNFKLLDAAAGLAYLGRNFRFTTELLARGAIANGVLEGDLVLVGGGDPILSREDLAPAVASVRTAGITRVSGAVLADDSIFDGQRYGSGWAWDDMPYYYQPPITALAVDEGTVGVTVTPGPRVGAPVSATLEANPGMMTVRSVAVTSARQGLDDVDCFRSPGSTVILIVGHMPLGKARAVLHCAVDDTSEQTVAVFTQMLDVAGIPVGSMPLGPLPPNIPRDFGDSGPAPPPLSARYPGAVTLWVHRSPALVDVIRRMMPPSDNFIAEHIFKMLPVAAFRQRGSFDGAAAVERKFIGWLGLAPESIDGGDGSGLSQGDRITPLDLAEILRWETRNPNGAAYVGALARAGIEGTVRHHLRGTDAVGRVRAKDGYIWHVSTFSGYALTRRHGLMIFSVMFNDVNGSLRPIYKAEDDIVKAIVDMP